MLAVLCAMFMLAPLAYHLLSRETAGAGGTADVLFSVIGAPLVFWLIWRRGGDAAALYDGGIACYKGGELVEVRWDEISKAQKNFVSVPPGGEDSAAPQYCVETADGRRLELAGLVDIEELWQISLENTPGSLFAGLIAEVRAGGTLSFGPFEMRAEGLTFTEKERRRRVEWARVRGIRRSRG